jgi:chromatin remodeling complex protein RSC6
MPKTKNSKTHTKTLTNNKGKGKGKGKAKGKTKKPVKPVVEEEEVIESEVDSDVSEIESDIGSEESDDEASPGDINLLDVESNDDDDETVGVSKIPSFDSDIAILKSYFQSLEDADRLRVYLTEFRPWFELNAKLRRDQEMQHRKLEKMLLEKLNRTSNHFIKEKKKKQNKKGRKNGSNNGFAMVRDVPKPFLDFFKKNKLDTAHIIRQGKPTKTIIVSDKMKRPDITALLYYYCDQKNLKTESDKRIINPDKELKKLFGDALGPNETLTFRNFQTKIKMIFEKSKLTTKVSNKEV